MPNKQYLYYHRNTFLCGVQFPSSRVKCKKKQTGIFRMQFCKGVVCPCDRSNEGWFVFSGLCRTAVLGIIALFGGFLWHLLSLCRDRYLQLEVFSFTGSLFQSLPMEASILGMCLFHFFLSSQHLILQTCLLKDRDFGFWLSCFHLVQPCHF